MAMSFEKSNLRIPSATPSWNLDTWQYLPTRESSNPYPVIIMAHGFSANKLMGLSNYAESFASIGYGCLVFDYRRWGTSDGAPRHVLLVKEQLEDYRTVIKYARQQPQFDPQRLILWGSSFAGGHVITLASKSSINAVAAISQCPYTGNSPFPPLSVGFAKTVFYALLDSVKQMLGLSPIYIPAAAPPGHVGGLTAEGSEEGVFAVCKEPSDWPNQIAASALLQISPYQPAATASSITCPIILIAPENDNLCPIQGAIDVAKAAEKGEIIKIPAAGHFEVYPGMPHYQLSIDSQLDFLKKHVPV